MSLHQLQVHPEFVEDCFGCKVGTLQLSPGETNSRLNISTRKWDKELQAYRDARAQGIQPDGTSMKKIEQAVKISNETGKAYGV